MMQDPKKYVKLVENILNEADIRTKLNPKETIEFLNIFLETKAKVDIFKSGLGNSIHIHDGVLEKDSVGPRLAVRVDNAVAYSSFDHELIKGAKIYTSSGERGSKNEWRKHASSTLQCNIVYSQDSEITIVFDPNQEGLSAAVAPYLKGMHSDA